MYEGIRDEHRTYANTATRIGNAFLALLSYLAGAPFLRKDTDDTASGLLTLLMGCVVGESKQIRINPDGSIVCGSIRVDGSAIFNELVFNHQNVLEGDTYFTDKGIIEKVEHTDLGQYTLTFRKEYEADHHTFHVNDILLGKVNRLDTGKTYYSFWLRVDKVDTEANTAVCSLYADSEVPGGKNYAPVETARVIRWGNTLDTSRQSVWFVSSNDGRWLFLQGVDKPIIEDSVHGSNYAAFVGLPPDIQAVHDLLQKGVISKDQPCLYAKTLLAERTSSSWTTSASPYTKPATVASGTPRDGTSAAGTTPLKATTRTACGGKAATGSAPWMRARAASQDTAMRAGHAFSAART